MTYTHLTTDELVMIESYYHQQTKVTEIAASLKRSRQTVYTVINFLKEGHSASNTTNNTRKTNADAVGGKL